MEMGCLLLCLHQARLERATLSVLREFACSLREHTNNSSYRSHPNGNIAEFLCSAGLAKVVDVSLTQTVTCIAADGQWHAGLLAPYGGLDRLRQAEKAAKEKRVGLWEGFAAPTRAGAASNGAAAGAPPTTKGNSFDATVTRIWGSDQLTLIAKGETKERRVQLASVRGPKGTGAKEAYWANEAKE